MEPRIQYAKTSDGVNIAYWTLGEGEPLVYTILGQWSHMQLEWEHPEFRRWYERLSEKRMVVRYDGRGSGLSDREVTDYSLEAHLLDLEAVVGRLGLKEFALFTLGAIGPAIIAYAARHPERVSHLILFATWARATDYTNTPPLQGMFGLLNTDWQMFTENAAHSLLGWSEGEQAHWFAALLRETTTPEAMRAATAAGSEFDATSLLSEVKSPTLVLHRREIVALDVAIARDLASRIPDARLVVVEGTSMAPQVGNIEPMLRAIDEFLREGEAEPAEPAASGAFRTILFTDVEGSTALTDRLGDVSARDLLREHERIVREALKAHGGSEVKTMGDGFMASFSSATRALECAIAIQSAFAGRNESAEEPIEVRIGLNAGEPIAEDDDLYGTAVNLAARIAAQGKGGEILASEAVRQIVAGKKFPFSDRGETTLRGFEDRVHIYQVSWREDV